MSVIEDLSVPYHQQDTDYYCGAACAQMVLAQIGAGLLDQDSLYIDNHSHSNIESEWFTGPDGLQWTLNNRRPSTFINSFALFALANEDSLSRKLVWTIFHYRVAPVALVYGSAHWIVVRGCDVSHAPAGPDDIGYSIIAFRVNNPWPPIPSSLPSPTSAPPPPPHDDTDGCGAGGARGIADEHIAYAMWQSTYMTSVPEGYWQGKFVAVCDPEPSQQRNNQPPPRQRPYTGDRLLTPEEAAETAINGLKDYGLLDNNPWKKTLAKTKPAAPFLVQRLDRLDAFYYIVPMQASRNAAPALTAVDARFGDYCQSIAIHERGANVLANLNFDRTTSLKKIVGTKLDLGNQLGRIPIRSEAVSLYPTLVWKPCRESLSPFYPFSMVTVGDHRVYIRVDGQVFTALHDQDRGI